MDNSFDLLILPLVRTAGHERPEVPGLLVAIQPRRPARFRDHDQLLLYFAQAGGAPLSLEQVANMLESLAKTYYNTPGTVTTAQKAVAEALNQYLLDRNLKNAATSQSVTGLLAQIVLRESRLYLAQSGPTKALNLSNGEANLIHEPRLAGQGMGITRTTPVHFTMLSLASNAVLVISPHLPVEWTPALLQAQGSQTQGPESLRRRLLSNAGPEVNAILLQAQPGKGQLRLLRPVRTARPTSPVPMAVLPSATQPTESSQALPDQKTDLPGEDHPIPVEEIQPKPAPRPAQPVASLATAPAPIPASKQPSSRQPQSPAGTTIAASLSKFFRKVMVSLGSLARRILPDESLFSLPPATMAFIAIAVPMVVVTVAAVTYFQRGRAAQYEVYITQARQAAQTAVSRTDPVELRQAWQATLIHLDQAEAYQSTQESKDMRKQAQAALDDIEGVERLDFKDALVDQLAETALISRMVTAGDDLYLLNLAEGVVLRALLTNEGYRIDPTFLCGPGAYEGNIVGALIDIAPLPRGNELDADVLAIDGSGNLLYCIPGDDPQAFSMQPPDINWGTPLAVTVDTGDLYILDPQKNAVWIYRNMNVADPPRQFFGEEIPPMQDVIDLAVNVNDLFLLHEDSHLTTCEYSGLAESPTRCDDPAIFSDPRPGRQSGATISDASFNEILFSPPPDPSIFLLDPNTKTIYHFSVRLTLQRLYQSLNPLPEGPVTAMAIDKNNRTAFLAIGNQVYSAPIP
jgi:hypothetical protein